MPKTIDISFPEFLANSLKMNEEAFKHEIILSSVLRLYQAGKISSGIASKVLNIPRLEFLDILGKNKISFFNEDIEEDILNA